MVNKKYDWQKIFQEFIDGGYMNIKEFCDYCADKGNGYPSTSAIYKRSTAENWTDRLKEKRAEATKQYLDKHIKDAEKRHVEHLLQFNRRLVVSQITLVESIIAKVQQGKMDGVRININMSDVINDTKRSLNVRTKEQDQVGAVVQINNQNTNNTMIDDNDRRKMIEGFTEEELALFRQKRQEIDDNKTIDIKGDVTIDDVEFTDAEEDE